MRFGKEKIILYFLGISTLLGATAFSQDLPSNPEKMPSRKYAFGKNDRDPFSPLISKSGLILIPRQIDVTGLNLRGIIYVKAEPLAIINDEVLKEGDTIAGYTVLSIKEKEVILEKDNQGFTLKLEEE